MRNKEKISIPLHCVGGHTALPSKAEENPKEVPDWLYTAKIKVSNWLSYTKISTNALATAASLNLARKVGRFWIKQQTNNANANTNHIKDMCVKFNSHVGALEQVASKNWSWSLDAVLLLGV